MSRWNNYIPNNFDLTQEVREFFDGLIIGDGCYQLPKKLSVVFSMAQIEDHADWIDCIYDYLTINNVQLRCRFSEAKENVLYKQKAIWALTSLNYRNLIPEYHRWYPNGKKIIPKDFNISNPITLANWFMGDGNTQVMSNCKKLQSHFATHCFTEDDVCWLQNEFNKKLTIESKVYLYKKKQPRLFLNHENSLKLFKLIKPYMVESFLYKVPNDPWIPGKCIVCNKELLDKRADAMYCNEDKKLIANQRKREARSIKT